MSEHRKYKREQKAYDDKQQTTLSPQSPTFIKVKQPPKVEVTINTNPRCYCPFCLHVDTLEKYLISTGHGWHKGLGKCPECQQQMRLNTLTDVMTPEQFAEFAYGYAASGYWNKVPFSKFNERLKQIGWLRRFWTKYKQLKGDDTTESYQEYMERQQREWAREAGILKE